MYRPDFAWAAGFFDAEGCFSASPGTSVATISQIGLECLDIFVQVLDEGSIHGPYEKATASIKRKPQWVYYAYGKEARAAFDALSPWLSGYRREQAARAFGFDLDSCELESFDNHVWAERIAWAGGFFDGEGCFSVCGEGLNARINNTDIELLEQFRKAVGFGKVYGPYQPHRTSFGRKEQYVYTVSGFERVQALLGLLWSNIGTAKRVKALDLLEDHLTFWKCGHRRGPTWKMHCPQCFKPGPKPGLKKRRAEAAGMAQLFQDPQDPTGDEVGSMPTAGTAPARKRSPSSSRGPR